MSFHVSGCSPVYFNSIYDENHIEEDYIETMEIVGMNDKGQEIRFLLPEEAVGPFLKEEAKTSESYKKIMQVFLDEHPEYVPSVENLINVDEMPGAMQSLYHAISSDLIFYGADYDSFYEPYTENEEPVIDQFIDDHPQLKHAILYDDSKGIYENLTSFSGQFFTERLQLEHQGQNQVFAEPAFSEKLKRVEAICHRYKDAVPSVVLVRQIAEIYSQQELSPCETNIKNVLKATALMEDITSKYPYKMEIVKQLITSGYTAATRMAKNAEKYTLSAGTAFQLGKLYLSDHGNFRADSAKAGMWFLIATTKDKSLKAEATKLQQQKAR